jgi:hypothetical protein
MCVLAVNFSTPEKEVYVDIAPDQGAIRQNCRKLNFSRSVVVGMCLKLKSLHFSMKHPASPNNLIIVR